MKKWNKNFKDTSAEGVKVGAGATVGFIAGCATPIGIFGGVIGAVIGAVGTAIAAEKLDSNGKPPKLPPR